MYAPSNPQYGGGGYGHGPGNNGQQQSQPPFNPNGAPPQQHPHQQQQPGQPQHMMYNPQQFAAGGPSPYGASQQPPGGGMGGGGANPGAMGMMQNNGMAGQGGANQHVSQYQTPYSAASYGANTPVPASNLPPNFMPGGNVQMNNSNMPMTPQQIQHMQNMQRMQPPPPSSTPTQPISRASPFAHANTPPDAGIKQSQFPTPQTATQPQGQIQNSQGHGTIVTPHTPNFPPGAQNVGGNMAAPMSPGSVVREQERVTLLLEINRELLMEVMSLQASQTEAKKEESSPGAVPAEGAEKDKNEKLKAISNREYMECMRRLQANLAYLAAIADKTHKPTSQAPTHPAILTAPPLVVKPASTSSVNSPVSETKKEEADDKKDPAITEDRAERIARLKAQYKGLQELFPEVDPRKETQQSNPTAKPQNQTPTPQQGGGQGPMGGNGGGPDSNAQQKMQNDQFRQKMMQQAQAQAQARAQAQQN